MPQVVEQDRLEQDRLADLLARVADKDRAAFAALYGETSAKLLGVVLRMTRDRPLAEEILQEAFLAVWQRADGFAPARGSAMGWLVTVARHKAIDRLRAQRARHEETMAQDDGLDALLDATQAAGGAGDADLVLSQSIRHCLSLLKEQQQRLVLLAFYYGLTHDELARTTGRPLGSVKSDVRRGLASLRVCLDQ